MLLQTKNLGTSRASWIVACDSHWCLSSQLRGKLEDTLSAKITVVVGVELDRELCFFILSHCLTSIAGVLAKSVVSGIGGETRNFLDRLSRTPSATTQRRTLRLVSRSFRTQVICGFPTPPFHIELNTMTLLGAGAGFSLGAASPGSGGDKMNMSLGKCRRNGPPPKMDISVG